MKSTRASGLVLAGAVGLAGLGVGATLGPSVASAATTSTTAVGDRVSAIKSAISGLVSNGTLTQTQADKVATTLGSTDGVLGGRGGGRGGRGGADLTTAASVIGLTAEELRTQLDSGKTLAQIAQAKGISQATLVDKLVAAEKTRIAAEVKAGTLTQAQADARIAGLQAQVTQQVTTDCVGGGGGRGHFGGRGGDADAPTAPSTPTTPTAPTTPTPTASAGSAA